MVLIEHKIRQYWF